MNLIGITPTDFPEIVPVVVQGFLDILQHLHHFIPSQIIVFILITGVVVALLLIEVDLDGMLETFLITGRTDIEFSLH